MGVANPARIGTQAFVRRRDSVTPERKAYLAGISGREKTIRSAIRLARLSLREVKKWWTSHKFVKPNKIRGYKTAFKRQKLILMAYKRELARLKGMDRVIRVKDTYMDCYGDTCFECKCGNEVDIGYYDYCYRCGRRLLIEEINE